MVLHLQWHKRMQPGKLGCEGDNMLPSSTNLTIVASRRKLQTRPRWEKPEIDSLRNPCGELVMDPTRLYTAAIVLMVVFARELASVGGVVSFCERANGADFSTCPEVSTFDIVDTAAYAGLWYQIGSTAQSKLFSEAGLDCLRARYTVDSDPTTAAALTVVNSGVRALGAVATLGVTSISTGAKEVCMRARDVCSYLDPASAAMQSVAELRKIAALVRGALREQAVILDDVAGRVEGYGRNVSVEFTMVAEHVARVERVDGYLSAGNGTATANVEQIKLDMIAVGRHIDVVVEFVHEMAAARSLLAQVAVKLVWAGQFVSSVDVTEASALIGGAEQGILLHAERMKSSIAAMSAASEVLLADTDLPFRNVSWSLPGVGTQNATAKGRLEFSMLGLTQPYWILALEGLPSRGYDAALVYSCTENDLLGTIQQGFVVLSRQPSLLPAILDRFLAVASSLGVDLDCENPFLMSDCNSAVPQVEAPTSV